MANLNSGDQSSNHGMSPGNYVEKPEGCWYFTRKEIEENSPSRRDGMDLKNETRLRYSYCDFLQYLGMSLKLPQQTVATAIIFCHRFYIRQSHTKYDWRTIATACMLLACKVEETLRCLIDVICVSYQILHKEDMKAALYRIRDKDVYNQQKELVLLGERNVLGTLNFDFSVQHPYKPLLLALKKLDVERSLLQVAWNFVNDGFRTSISLQYKAPQIAASAIYMAVKFLKLEHRFDIEKVLVQEFDITRRQLADISSQVLELYGECNTPSSKDYQGDELPHQARAEATTVESMHYESIEMSQTVDQPSEIGTITACEGNSVNNIQHEEQEPMPSQANAEEASAQAELTNTIAAIDMSNGRNMSKNDAISKLNTEKLRAVFLRRKASGEIVTQQLDELEAELEQIEVSTTES